MEDLGRIWLWFVKEKETLLLSGWNDGNDNSRDYKKQFFNVGIP